MTTKDKIIMIVLGVLTLGIYPTIVFNRNTNNPKKAKLSVASKVSVDITKLQKALGGTDNIAGTEFTHTKVKIFIKDKSKVSVEAVRALKSISGVFATSVYVTIVVGNQAKELSKLI